jgi:4-amino-4-deoxy-L-arabinose transferase-like glycosyltransferase
VKPAAELTRTKAMSARAPRLVLDLCVLVGFCAFFFFFGLSSVGLAGADEPRYAQIAREMLARHDWVTPVLRGHPWLEKPVLYYWQAMLSYSVFGASDWVARLPSAVDATVLVAVVYWFVRRFYRGMELDASLITASTAFIVGFGHAASTDMPLSASFAIAMLAWTAWRSGAAGSSARATASDLSGYKLELAVFYIFLGVATLAKGPVAPLLAALIVGIFCALRREPGTIRRTLWWPGLLLYLAIAAPWYALVQWRTGNFFRVFILEHNFERFSTTVYRHTAPFWYFVPITLLALLPWTVLAVAGVVRGIRHLRAPRTQATDLALILVIWGILPVIFFSFSGSKLPGYILPALPPFAILAALWLRDMQAADRGLSRFLVWLHGLLAGAMLSLVLISPYLVLRLHPPGSAVAVSAGAGLAVLCAILLVVRFLGLRALRLITLLPVIIGLGFILRLAAPVLDVKFSARPVARELHVLRPAKVPVAIFEVDRELEYGLDFYLNEPVARYERGEVLHGDHLLVSRSGARDTLQERLPQLRFMPLSKFSGRDLEFYWVTPK